MDGYFEFCEKRTFRCFCSHFFESFTAVEHAGQIRGHVTMDGGVRQGCLISGFLFTMTFGPIFRWSHDAVFPRDLSLPAWLQPTPCAYADDFAVTASSLRTLMSLLLFLSMTELLSTIKKRYCKSVVDTCPDFGDMNITRVAKYVDAMISPDGYRHRWTASRHKFLRRSAEESWNLRQTWSNPWLTTKYMRYPC